MGYETILVDKADGVATVTLSRPEARNAIDVRMREELVGAFDELAGLGEPRLPKEEGVDIAPFQRRHHFRRLQGLNLDLVQGQIVFPDVIHEIQVSAGGTGVSDGPADQVLRLLDVRPRRGADLLPAGG